MRIVYDDTKALDFIELLDHELRLMNVRKMVEYEWGMERVQRHLIKKALMKGVAQRGFEIGSKIIYAHGIGNNNQMPVYCHSGKEIQECCALNINVDPFGAVYVSVEDYAGRRLGRQYKVTTRGVEVH